MKKAVKAGLVLVICGAMWGCSNIITYVRHDETKGNIQCSGDQALKRDSTCNASTK
ncbi:hypothetical protein MUU49_19280 [Scandinavium goeteborgense]|uniref:hypothetical protein n=1 Tax=Scandinavium goeteborgense TaxID=1851514 RepID=UPI0021667B85|nr:hypothetical protein [Scandinavium goeteborgense]MCS2154700.1 hypothetical protein [Scandinavium goeteborgense]